MTTQIETALEKLKDTGVRMTPQRHAILDYLLNVTTHPTADDIYKSLYPRFPSMSVATVYNNLKLFVAAGLVRELTYGDQSSRFDADMSEHYHAVCVVCGKIVDFEHSPLSLVEAEHSAGRSTGFLVEGHRFEVRGRCPECQHTN